MTKRCRILSVILSVLFVVYALPLSVMAEEITSLAENAYEEIITEVNPENVAENETEEDVLADAHIVGEEVALRSESVKHFRMSNGLYTAVEYGMAVHYDEDGQWVDYDNTLVLEDAEDEDDIQGYTPEKNDVKIKFSPNSSNPNMIKLKYDKYQLRISLEGADKTKVIEVNNPTGEGTADVTDSLPLLTSSARYNDILPSTDLEYVITGSNIKENIIVKDKCDSYVYKFNLRVKDVTPIVSEDGGVHFVNENGQNIFDMPKGFMYDNAGNISEAVTYTIEANGNKKYVLTVSADTDWINEEGRAFPVTIDPPIIIGKFAQDNQTNIVTQYMGLTDSEPAELYNDAYVGFDSYTNDEYVMYTKIEPEAKPSLPANSVLCDARMYIAQGRYSKVGMSSLNVGVYEVTASPWYSGIANRTNISSTMLDYAQVSEATEMTPSHLEFVEFNVTEAAKAWYNDSADSSFELVYAAPVGTNFTTSNCANAVFYHCSSSASGLAAIQPRFVVTYRNTVGIEPYYTYQTHDVKRAGTVYIADNSGEMTVVKPLVSSPSNTLPFTLSLVYNSHYSQEKFTYSAGRIITSDFSNMILANGWKLSAQQSVVPITLQGIEGDSTTTYNYLVYTDGDGTQHYFSEETAGSGTFKDEDGLGLTITSDTSYYYLRDDKGNEAKFVKSSGLLIRSYDTNNNEILYHYSTTGALLRIAWKLDGQTESTICTLSYDSNKKLTSVTDAAGRITTFTYNSDSTLIGCPDGTTLTYATYGAKSKLSRVYDNESHCGIAYTYDSSARVSTATAYVYENGVQVNGAVVSSSYPSPQKTVITSSGSDGTINNSNDIRNVYLFDYWGRTVNVHTIEGNSSSKTVIGASMAQYTDVEGTDERKNRVEVSSTIGVPSVNLLSNPGAESRDSSGNAYAWNKTNPSSSRTCSTSSTYAHTGTYSLKISSTDQSKTETTFSQTRNQLTVGKTYTFSAYVRAVKPNNYVSGNTPEYYLRVGSVKSDICNEFTNPDIDDGWVRLSVTFTATSATHSMWLCTNGFTGDIYFDDMQLEEGSGASTVSLQNNGGMIAEETWVNSSSVGSSYTTASGTYLSYSRGIKVVGDVSRQGYSYSTISLNKDATDGTYTLSGWAKANSVPTSQPGTKNQTPTFGLKCVLTYSDGTTGEFKAQFSSDVTDWQYVSLPIVPDTAKSTVTSAKVYLSYDYNSGEAYFDNISFIRDNAVQYEYDEDGNVKHINTAEETEDISANYDNGVNLTDLVDPGSGTYEYTYDEYNNVKTASHAGVTMTLTRGNAAGLVTQTTISASGMPSIVTTGQYDSTLNFVTSQTDALGNTTSYTYDTSKGLVKDVTAPNGTETQYLYYANTDRTGMVSAFNTGGSLPLATAQFFYGAEGESEAYVAQILRTSMSNTISGTPQKTQSYFFDYDAFGNMTSVKVGETPLSTRTYNKYNGNLLTQTNPIGNTVYYSYDNLNRVTSASYADSTTPLYENFYNGDGSLSKTVDLVADEKKLYTYDALGRLLTSTTRKNTDNTFDHSVSYEYDTFDRLKSVHYSGAFLVDDPSETYTYNNTDGTLSSFSALYGDAYTYTYDGLKRLQSTQITGENATFTKNYGYATNSTGTSTLPNLLTYSNSSGLWMSNQLTYDNMNRIVTSNQTSTTSDARTYVYDDLGQLIEEQIPALDLKYYYRYDNAGNMIKWQQVGYRNNQVKYEGNYTYGDANWQDRLTAYGDFSVFYEGTSGLMGSLASVYDYDDGKNIYWDEQGHLYYVYLNDGTVLNYNFNASGQLESKWVDGESLSLYKYEGDRLISQTVNGVNFLIFLYDESGNVDAIKYRGEKYYLVRNIQGDVVELRDEYGGLVAKYTYNAYGYLLSVRDQYTSEITDMTHIAHINPIRYRGYYYDTDLKWYYLNSRYYSPELGRFVSSDALISTSPLGLNMFAYCYNDPVNYVDPSGYCPNCSCGVYQGLSASCAYYMESITPYSAEYWAAQKPGTRYIPVNDDYSTIDFAQDVIGYVIETDWDGYVFYDSELAGIEGPAYERILSVEASGLSGDLISGDLGLGGVSFDFFSSGWKTNNMDLSILNFGHAEAGLQIENGSLNIGAFASVYSPSVTFDIGDIKITAGVDLGSIGASISCFGSSNGVKIGGPVGFTLQWER